MFNTAELKNNKKLQVEFTEIINNFLDSTEERRAVHLASLMRNQLGLSDFRYIGYGYTSNVIGDNNVVIKIYRDDVVKETPSLCNDIILKDIQKLNLNFIPQFIGGVEGKFIITEYVNYDCAPITNLGLDHINEIYKQVLLLHLNGICANDLHNDNIVWSEERQKFVFIDVGAFSKNGYVDHRTDFKVISKNEIKEVPLIRCATTAIPFTISLWFEVYEPLIKQADRGIINPSNFDINTVDVLFEKMLVNS